MQTNAAQEIVFRTTIGACNSESHLRVYMQDVVGNIREAMYERDWTNGTEKNSVAHAKMGSPIAVASMELDHIRLYYMTHENMLQEAAYDHGKGWYEGSMNKMKIHMAPYSKLATCFLKGANMTLRVYCQMPDNTIQEFGWNNDNSGWKKMTNFGLAMPGTSIACTSFKTSNMRVRVYFQDMSLNLKEKCWDQERERDGWYDGGFKTPSSYPVPPRAALACTSFPIGHNEIGMSVFYVTANSLQEMHFDGKWHERKMDVNCIPGSEVAVVSWGSEKHVEMRVYFQKGEHVSGVTEWMFTGGKWKAGTMALPPA